MEQNLNGLSLKLKQRLEKPLPGIEVQLRMAHKERRLDKYLYDVPVDARVSAVLILLYEKAGVVKTVLIQRTEYKGVHSRQVAFPGGKKEKNETIEQAALRETEEEIGINAKDIKLLGKLTDLYIPPSNFLVYPFIGTIDYNPEFNIDKKEVEELLEISLDDLINPSLVEEKEITLSSGLKVHTPFYNIAGKTVWGATAMIISEFTQVWKDCIFE